MPTAVKILLVSLSGLLIVRNVSTTIQVAQIEITEEASSIQKEIVILQPQAAIKKTNRIVTVLTRFSSVKLIKPTKIKVFPATAHLWLRHRSLLI